ncbi:MAG: glycosyltransferase family 2 protein [Alphaproteobacteria bacterium]|nr:glycosyltransferase family 2 protein [Alphaproteobacteria bacterium]
MNDVSPMPALPPHHLSIVVPMYQEEDSVRPFVARVTECLEHYPHPWELLLVNDGSRDGTRQAIERARSEHGGHIRLIELTRNYKQTAAMQAGIDQARGDVIVTLDGDLQNDPIDIPRMVSRLLNEDLDLVAGWRRNRQDALVMRKLPSRMANALIARMSGLDIKDNGCSLKVFRASILRRIRLYGEMHRFIPAWLSTVTSPARIAQEPVSHHARQFGESKYGISRTFRVILDLFFVYFFMRYRARPGHFFGGLGLWLLGIAGAILAYLLGLKLLGESIGTRPLLLVGFFFLIAGVQSLMAGILAEVLVRVLFESGTSRSYQINEHQSSLGDLPWHQPKT